MVTMAAIPKLLLLLPLLLLLSPTPASSASAVSTTPYTPPTVPELMDHFGLPRGLLPSTARRYLLHDDGSFDVYLDDGCEVHAGGYRVFYSIKISGKVGPGAITGLKGVHVRVLSFVWTPITGVEVAGGVVTISIGPVKKSFPAMGFTASPRCLGSASAAVMTETSYL